MTAATNSYIDAIDRQVAERGLLLHPFYKTWLLGTLSREALRDYAVQYYRHVAAFPTYLSALHSHTEDASTRGHILLNLIDEEAGHPNHPELWLRFAEGLGVSRNAVEGSAPWHETSQLVDTFRSVCRDRETPEGLAALYAYESQIPAVAESKIAGLVKFYDMEDARSLEYFKVHIEADREHSSVERKLLTSYVNQTNFASIQKSVADVLESLWEMLSGVCRRHAIPV